MGGSLKLGWANMSIKELEGLLLHQPLRVYARNAILREDSHGQGWVSPKVLVHLSRTLQELDMGANAMYLAAPSYRAEIF